MDPNATYNHLYAHRLDTFKAHPCIRKMLNKKLCYKTTMDSKSILEIRKVVHFFNS